MPLVVFVAENGLVVQVDDVVQHEQAVHPVHVIYQKDIELEECLVGQRQDGRLAGLLDLFLLVVVDQSVELWYVLLLESVNNLLVELGAFELRQAVG